MKKFQVVCVFAFVLVRAVFAGPNQEIPVPGGGVRQSPGARQGEGASAVPEISAGGLYAVTAEDGADGENLGKELEMFFGVYGRLFHFDPSLLAAPLNVRVFGAKEAYDSYVAERLGSGEERPGAVYLHYSQRERRELVVHYPARLEASALAHQSFIQYLRAFAAGPPSWMREGFAIYFSSLRFDPPLTLAYEENLQWLEAAKSMGDKMPGVEALLTADISGAENQEDFRTASWALVSFLLNGGQEPFRTLTDSFMLLSPDADAAENSRALAERISLWNDFETLDRDFKSYLASRRTFREVMEEGHRAYTQGDFMNAEFLFFTAMNQKPREHAPYYYLGLISYEAKNYAEAEEYYTASLERGGDGALVNYALGINAAAAGRNREAGGYLEKAAGLDAAKYGARVEELLRKIGQ